MLIVSITAFAKSTVVDRSLKPVITIEPKETELPEITYSPKATNTPQPTDVPEATAEPTPTTEPITTEKPKKKHINKRWNKEEAYMLAKLSMAEAEDQDIKGKALVIMVVLNRVSSKKFPDNINDVIFQDKQFAPISNGRYDRVEPDQDCWDALSMVERGWDESEGALYFESESSSTWHRNHLQLLFRHEEHIFYMDKE